MTTQPLISIITVNLNNLEGLRTTVNSVLAQKYKNFEYLVIDGASNDGSREFLEKHNEQIDYWISEEDLGIYNAMNKGVKKANGVYLLFLNSGDHFFDNESLKKNYGYLKVQDIIYFNLVMVKQGVSEIAIYPKNLRFSHFVEDTLPHPATFIKKTLFDKLGFYDESLKIVSDWKFFINSICKYNSSYLKIDETLSVYYLDGISSSVKNEKLIKEERQKVLSDDFSPFMEDYRELMKARASLNSSRYKMCTELQKNFLARKINNFMLRILIGKKSGDSK
ncbi:glycosyltransferase [Gramella jeungdoensis]|uniref:Glycosyltransferase n=1 Tax=Gramella jeungdoensis TaxID=708091 RepID=A0ABT0Z0E7_9FLAO|nr:glycosyltransferase family 2 protein [Gramella jeungdoensis]MCM8569201.1 glycosyltransferase [Gramella jeungdoensis]